MSSSVFIGVPTFRRYQIAYTCIGQLFRSKSPQDFLKVYDDCSEIFDLEQWKIRSDELVRLSENFGSDRLRDEIIREFIEDREEDFLYLTDNDAFHDFGWRDESLRLWGQFQCPVSLFRTRFHTEVEEERVIIRPSFPGISVFISRSLLESQWPWERLPGESFDWHLCSMFSEIVCSIQSYVMHLGQGGVHNRNWDYDVEKNPTPFLKGMRPKLISWLEGHGYDPLAEGFLEENVNG